MPFMAMLCLFIIGSFIVSCSEEPEEDEYGYMEETENAIHLLASSRSGSEDDDDDEDDDEEEEIYEDCFQIVYPITIQFTDGSTQVVNNDEELEMLIDQWIEQNPESEDYPSPVFPVEIVIDSTTVTVQDDEELCEIIYECYEGYDDEDEYDDEEYEDEEYTVEDIIEEVEELADCFEFVYPIDVELGDSTQTETVGSAEDYLNLMISWFEQNPDDDDLLLPVFPVQVILQTDTLTVNSEDELEMILDDCYKEDDDDDDGM